MRKSNLRISLAVVCFLIAISSFSQGIQWRLAGNNNITAGVDFLGTTNAQPIDFRTNNTIRSRVTPIGLIGIGTNFTAPSALLHLNDQTGNVSSGLLFQTDGLGTNNNVWQMTTSTGGFFNVGIPAGTEDVEFNILGAGNYIFNTPGLSPRMIIHGLNNNGRTTVGDIIPAGHVPREAFNIWQNGPTSTYIRFQNALSGNANLRGIYLGLANNLESRFISFENQPMRIGVNDAQAIYIDNPTSQLQNTGTTPSGGNWVGLGQIFSPGTTGGPQAHLHIHGFTNANGVPFGRGVRPWFNTGVLCTETSDGMYVGLREAPGGNTQQHYAIINWSDDNFGSGGSDFLSFNFTSDGFTGGPLFPNTPDGMEVARFNPGRNNGTLSGTFGVGNFMALGTFTEPTRRVEILDAEPVTGANANVPQLRLTYQYNANPANGIFTEFQTTNLGDMFINPYDFTQPVGTNPRNLQERYVGIHTATPGNTMEINSQYLGAGTANGQPFAVGFGFPTGWAGLRFSDLTANSIVQANPGIGVLSVNLNGDVIYVPGGATGPMNADNGCSTNGPTPGFVHLGNTIGNNQSFLQDNREIPTNNFNLLFSDPTQSGGTPLSTFGNTYSFGRLNSIQTSANPKMYVHTDVERVSGMFINDASLASSSGFSNTHVISPTSFAFNDVGPSAITGYVYGGSGFVQKSGVVGIGDASTTTINTPVSQNVYGVYGQALGSTGFNINAVGVKGSSPYPNASTNIGGSFEAKNSIANNVGVLANAITNSGVVNTGVGAQATGASTNYGVYAAAPSAGANDNYGIFTTAGGATNNYGIYSLVQGNTTNYYAGWFNGNVTVTNGSFNPSDSVLKTNVQTIDNAISKIKLLQPKSFYFDTTNSYGVNLSSKKQYGFISQNVQPFFPELVSLTTKPALLDSLGNTINPSFAFSTLNYQAFIGLLTAGMQQQQLSIDSLRNETSANVCGGITTDYVSKWSGTDLCNSQLFDNGFNTGIGGTSSNTLFRVYNTSASSRNLAAEFYTSLPGNTGTVTGLIAQAEGSTSSNIGLSAAGINSGGVANTNYGIQSYATGASGENYAGLFVADQPITTPGSTSYALYAQTTGGADNNYGIFAKATGGSLNNWAGYFDGNVNVNGSYYQNGSLFTSDQTLKTNIDSINNATAIVSQLKPRSFYFDTTNAYGMSFSAKKQYGLIAQDVQAVLPELVSTVNKPADYDTSGNMIHQSKNYQSLNYNAFIALLIKNNQEMEKRIATLESVVNSCCNIEAKTTSNGGKSVTEIEVELSNADAIVLNQNVPNPFAEQTTITYNIPQNVTFAQILFYDINGRQIKAVDIHKKGKGQLNVFANDLSNGVYSYTLIVDGKIFETKKMIKQQ